MMAEQPNSLVQQLLANLNTAGQLGSEVNPKLNSVNYIPDARVTNNAEDNSCDIPGLGLLPTHDAQPSPVIDKSAVLQQIHNTRPGLQNLNRSSSPVTADASGITTWPAALKYVTKHIANDEKIADRIRKLISDQHKLEHQSWREREALLARQEGRSDTSQQVTALLMSLGGKAVPAVKADPKAIEAEIKAFDRKVYSDLVSLASNFDRQLKAMGIPFYAIKHELVILEPGREKLGPLKGRIDRGELRELQRKMLQTLEDLFLE